MDRGGVSHAIRLLFGIALDLPPTSTHEAKNERLDQGYPPDPRPQRMDQTILGRGQTRRSGTATLPELRPLPASPLRDLCPVRQHGSEVRTRPRGRRDLRLHHHVSHRRQAIRLRGALRQHHRRTRGGAGCPARRQPAGSGVYRGEGWPPRGGHLRETERRHHAAAVPSRAGRITRKYRMWDNRCKIAVSGVGYSKVSRMADIPLAAHALEAVKGAVADSGLQMSDIDGLASYPELPATGHAEVDGISVVSVNCMMAMLKLPALTWHIQVGTTNIGGAVQQAVNALLAGVCKYAVVWRAMHNPRGTYQNLPGTFAQGATQFTAPYGFGGPGQGMAVAY